MSDIKFKAAQREDGRSVKECDICHYTYRGYGNNADPAGKGRCCDDCNVKIVMPMCIMRLRVVEGRKP